MIKYLDYNAYNILHMIIVKKEYINSHSEEPINTVRYDLTSRKKTINPLYLTLYNNLSLNVTIGETYNK